MQEDAIQSTFDAWNYESNITDHNQKISLAASQKSGLLTKKLGKEAQAVDLTQAGRRLAATGGGWALASRRLF